MKGILEKFNWQEPMKGPNISISQSIDLPANSDTLHDGEPLKATLVACPNLKSDTIIA